MGIQKTSAEQKGASVQPLLNSMLTWGGITKVSEKNAVALHEDRHVDLLVGGRFQGKHSTLLVKNIGNKNIGK